MTDGVLQGQPFQDMEPENIELREVRPKNTDPQDGQVQNAEPQDGRVQNIDSQDGQVQNTGSQDSQAPGAAFQDQPPQAVWLQNIQPRRMMRVSGITTSIRENGWRTDSFPSTVTGTGLMQMGTGTAGWKNRQLRLRPI